MPPEAAVAPSTPTMEAPITTIPAATEGDPTINVQKGSALDRAFSSLEAKATGKPPAKPTQPAQKKQEPPKPSEKKQEQPENKEEKPADETHGEEPKAEKSDKTAIKPVDQGKESKTNGKANPWKIVDQLRNELAEAKKSTGQGLAEKEKGEFLTKLQEFEKRNAELENEMRFVNYEKSAEFKTKYEQPYDNAWKKAAGELKEIPVITGEGTSRPATPQDLLKLVNMPLGEARALADEMFGPFANDIMAHRKEIRNLFDSRSQALEEARKTGAEREKQQREMIEKGWGALQNHVKEQWVKENESWTKHEKVGKYLTPSEGDEEGNKRLAKGFALADKALATNPMDPNLSTEQRAEAVKSMAALRNRAAAFGRLTHIVEARDKEIAALKEKLKGYESSEPGAAGGTAKENGTAKYSSRRDEVFSGLDKIAKPR
jgi:hypothetical protein